jgi:hypothetical protein
MPFRMEYGQIVAGIRVTMAGGCWFLRNGIRLDTSVQYKTKRQAIAVCERLNSPRMILDAIDGGNKND